MNQVITLEAIHADLASALTLQGVAALLPTHVSVEQFTRTAATALVTDPELQNADRQSLVMALTRCARDGLLPDGREAAMVTFNKNFGTPAVPRWGKAVQYLPMVDGVLKRARQSGQVANITGKVVYMGDKFDYWVDEHGEHIEHRPVFEDRGEIRLVYAFAKLTSGELMVEVMTRADVERVRDTVGSADKATSPWKKWFDRMALKTVLHRLARRLPCASELFSLLEVNPTLSDEEKPLNVAHSAPPRRRLRDALSQMKLGSAAAHVQCEPAQEAEMGEVVTAVPSAEPEHPEYEALLNALDDVTDEHSYVDVARHCTELAKTLSAADRDVLRDKLTQTRARIEKTVRRSL
ncbi:recombinase RecT [Serratia fonticola]|uniref:recombinase RecT n=1 Tax=Serratia fonticola TaxID=47917 RepID=UPI00301D344D